MEMRMKHPLIVAIALLGCLPGTPVRAQTATDLSCTSCVSEAEIANGAVTSVKIANGTIVNADIKASAVTTDKIKNGTILEADLATALRDDIGGAIADITFARVSASGGGAVGAQCPAGRVAVAASCECTDGGGTRNLGVLFGCTVTGTGAAAGCFDEAISFNPQLPAPLANVRAICMGAVAVDGTPWTSTAAGLASDTLGPEAAAARDADLARWMREQQASFEDTLARFRNQRATFEARTR